MVLLRHGPHSFSPYLGTFPSLSYPCHKWLSLDTWAPMFVHGMALSNSRLCSCLKSHFSSLVTDPPGNEDIQSVHFRQNNIFAASGVVFFFLARGKHSH